MGDALLRACATGAISLRLEQTFFAFFVLADFDPRAARAAFRADVASATVGGVCVYCMSLLSLPVLLRVFAAATGVISAAISLDTLLTGLALEDARKVLSQSSSRFACEFEFPGVGGFLDVHRLLDCAPLALLKAGSGVQALLEITRSL